MYEIRNDEEKKKFMEPTLLNVRAALLDELDLIADAYWKVGAQIAEIGHGKIVVTQKVYPGVLISISGFKYLVQDVLGKGQFTLEDRKVVFGPVTDD